MRIPLRIHQLALYQSFVFLVPTNEHQDDFLRPPVYMNDNGDKVLHFLSLHKIMSSLIYLLLIFSLSLASTDLNKHGKHSFIVNYLQKFYLQFVEPYLAQTKYQVAFNLNYYVKILISNPLISPRSPNKSTGVFSCSIRSSVNCISFSSI